MKRQFTRLSSEESALLIDTITYALAKAIPGGLGLLSVLAFVRLVGESDFGRYALALAIINIWVATSSGWFYQGVLRLAGQWHDDGRHVPPVAIRGLGLSLVVFSPAAICHFSFAQVEWSVLTIGSAVALGIFMILQTSLLAVLQARLSSQRALRAELTRTGAGFAVALVLASVMHDRVAGLVIGTAIGYCLSILVERRFSKQTRKLHSGTNRVPTLRAIWNYGWPLSLWFGGQMAMPLIDRSLIAAHCGLDETGRYAAISELFTRCYSLLLFPIVLALLPRIIRLWDSGDRVGARGLLVRAWVIVIGIGTGAVVLASLTEGAVVRLLLGEPGSAQAHLVLPLAIGGAVWHLALLAHKPLELVARTDQMFFAMFVAVATKFGTTLWLLPAFGPAGAASATIAAGLLYCAIVAWLGRSVFSKPSDI